MNKDESYTASTTVQETTDISVAKGNETLSGLEPHCYCMAMR